MERKILSLRLEPDVYETLRLLSKTKRQSMNKLVAISIEKFLQIENAKTIDEMEAIITQLKAYRKRDPDFKEAIKRFVDAEFSGKDPVEGVVITDG